MKKVPPHIGDRYHEQSADYKDQGADTVIVGYENEERAWTWSCSLFAFV
nr:hypothetical protein [[Eubacterium] cellulosolvens]